MKITSAKPAPRYRLELRFDNGESGVVDLSSFAGKGVCAAWLEPSVFERVAVTDDGAVEWPGGIDFCPDALYLRMSHQRPEAIFPSLRDRLSHA
jgi:Protein of unknown function (DUF2442)